MRKNGEFEALSKESKNTVNLNSTCVVFAESEIVSLLANGIKKQDIINALHYSVAKRISNLTGDQDIEEDLYIDGGSAMNKGLVAAIEDEPCYDAEVLPHPQFSVAYGAACCI